MMSEGKKPLQLWVFKDALGSSTDFLEHEPTRHTISDFIPMIEKLAYDKAVLGLRDSCRCNLTGPLCRACETLKELGEG
jgi:hypothetical protein